MSGTEVGAFDATGYRQHVLSTLRGASKLDLSDPFFIVDLPVDVDDTELIRARITALVGFWNKERSPNYKALAAELAKHRADLEAVLLDPARRAEGAAQGRAARATADADRYGALDSLAAKLAARYAASLIEDAKDRLRDTVAEKVIVDGELNAADYEACVRRVIGFGFGLSSEQARLAVRRVATELGATLAVAPAVDYLICPNCREPQPASRPPASRYCGADVYLPCPACGQQAEAAAVACPHRPS